MTPEGAAVVEVLAVAEPPGGALGGGATQRVPWQPRAKHLSFIINNIALFIIHILSHGIVVDPFLWGRFPEAKRGAPHFRRLDKLLVLERQVRGKISFSICFA